MLPLWIIDLREKTSRRDHFESLVGKINHVYIANPDITNQNRQNNDADSEIVGNYWRYSCMEDYFYGISIDGSNGAEIRDRYDKEHVRDEVEKVPTPEGTAERLYKFQSDLVKEGQAFIEDIRKSNAHPDIKINVVVLGDLTEGFTRIVFPSVGRILQKEKGRMLPHHIHQGMEIVGMLYVPTNINTRDVHERKSMQRTLTEIDVQHRVNDMRGYDHMMFYQDVQNRTETAYPKLDDEQLSEYLLQCLVHLYLACDQTHPLLSGTTAADVFYFSMGATSLHYNADNECIEMQNKLAHEFVRQLKSEGIDEKKNDIPALLDEETYSPANIFKDYDVLQKIGEDIIDIEEPKPHPYRDYLERKLKRYYYGLYLKFFSRNLMHDIHSNVESCTRDALEMVAIKSKRKFTDVQKFILERIEVIVGGLSANDGGIPTIERLFKDLQEKVSRKRQDIRPMLKQKYWRNVEETHITRNIRDKFMEYHDAYVADIKNKSEGKLQMKMKQEAVNELNALLSQESTMLSMIGRGLLMAIMLVLAVVPLLCLISPKVVNLGNVRRFSEVWSVIIFFVPVIILMSKAWRYQRRKNRLINNLKAIYLHDAFARVANRMESEINTFYDRVIDLSGRYIDRCTQIMKELGPGYKDDEYKEALFPETMFNQPLVGGKFGDKYILPPTKGDDVEVSINYIRYKLDELTPVEHFLFINQNKSLVKELFCDVRIPENLLRRVNEEGKEELLTAAQQEQEMQKQWNYHQEQFYDKLKDAVRESVNIYENSTIGEKILHHVSQDGKSLFKKVISYAASNGEMTSSSDLEYVDAKYNEKRLGDVIAPYFSSCASQFQPDAEHAIYKQYVFITRWRCFDKIAFNRILPTEDFDMKVHNEVVESDEMEKKYEPRPSSLLLWALSLFDSSTEWFRLFDSDYFEKAYEDKNVYRKILNQND